MDTDIGLHIRCRKMYQLENHKMLCVLQSHDQEDSTVLYYDKVANIGDRISRGEYFKRFRRECELESYEDSKGLFATYSLKEGRVSLK